MSNLRDDDDGTAEIAPDREIEAFRRQFEALWQRASSDGTLPQIDNFLEQVPEADRAALRAELEHIESGYRAARSVVAVEAVPKPRPAPAESASQDPGAPTLPATIVHAPAAADDVAAPQTDPLNLQDTHKLRPGGESSSSSAATLDSPRERPLATDEIDFSLGPVKAGETPAPIPSVAGYEILGVLGRGGMGVVYKARHVKLNRLVALKMVLAGAHASAHQLARFHTEAEAVARLQHPNIVQIYEVGEFEGLPFFSLEFVSGGTLAKKIDGKPQPPREAAVTVELLACAMAAAHERGILHRDLKPANVLLDNDGLPKITDFGLAKRIEDDSSQTKSGTLMGTPSYMSPEQARGDTREIGVLSDQYSLGAILYELLTGRPPFAGPTMLETLYQVRHQEPVPPTRLQPRCPRDLETICLKCLQKEPHQRYANCQALAEDLHRFLAGEPIRARPVSWFEHGWRWCRRNPRVAILSASVGVLFVAVVISLALMAVRMGREREALAETRRIANERLGQAGQRIAAGNYRQAQDTLQFSDPLLAHADLTDVRIRLGVLKAQIDVYAEFRDLLDSARFACRFGSRQQKEQGRRYCAQLVELYDELEGESGKGAAGLPPLDDEQRQFFKEDVFEALLTYAQVEQDLAAGGDKASQRQAAEKALALLNRAEQVLPGTRALHVHRAPCWARLGNDAANKADMEKAKSIAPTSAVDRFWHGFANLMRGSEAARNKDFKAAHESYQKAIADYAAFLQLRPDHFWGYFNWANAHVYINERRDLHDAWIGFTTCTRLRPDFPWPYNNRGTVLLRLGQPEAALVEFDAALARNQDYAEAYANRGVAYVALKKDDAALADFAKALALNAEQEEVYAKRAEIYRKRKQYDLAVADYTRLLALSEDKKPILEKRLAANRALKRVKDILQDYGELLELAPRDLKLRAERVDLLLAQGDYAAARDDLTAMLEQEAMSPVLWRTRAIVNWQKLKDFDAALADFQNFAELAPQDPEPHRCMGVIYLGRRQYDAALAGLQRALALRPGYPEAIWAVAQIHLRQRRFDDALQVLEPLVAKLPDGPPQTLNVRAGVYQALGKLTEAAADYQRMIELVPEKADAYVGLARIYEQQGEPAKAAECFERLVKAAPKSKWAYVRRAEYRRDHAEFDSALADCDAAAGPAPGWSVPALVRASVTAARGRPQLAVAEAERVLKDAPKNDGQVLYAAACVWSLAARATKDTGEAKSYADRAADLLAQALDRGFHDLNYPEHNRLTSDPALAAIRDLPKVRALLDR
jgi:eukaryotic-like serine/threonine-protein kinase